MSHDILYTLVRPKLLGDNHWGFGLLKKGKKCCTQFTYHPSFSLDYYSSSTLSHSNIPVSRSPAGKPSVRCFMDRCMVTWWGALCWINNSRSRLTKTTWSSPLFIGRSGRIRRCWTYLHYQFLVWLGEADIRHLSLQDWIHLLVKINFI